MQLDKMPSVGIADREGFLVFSARALQMHAYPLYGIHIILGSVFRTSVIRQHGLCISPVDDFRASVIRQHRLCVSPEDDIEEFFVSL